MTAGGLRLRPPRRTPVGRAAIYRGVQVWLSSTDGVHYFASYHGRDVPAGFLQDMVQVGRWEHLGKIPVGDPRLE